MKRSAISWLIKYIRKYVPTLILMVAVDIVQAPFWVFFALGTQRVIDNAIGGGKSAFFMAVL